MSENLRFLLVDDEVLVLDFLSSLLKRRGFYVETATDAIKALARMDEHYFDVVITDLSMPHMDGLELLTKLKEKHPDVSVLLLTGFSTVESAIKAIKLGAFDYIEKPFEAKALLSAIDKLIKEKQFWKKINNPNNEHRKNPRFENIIGTTSQMHTVFEEINSVAGADISVLIVGENGTGKELVANAIHYRSPRKEKPFIKINCAALAESVIESELFGHERGSFTGAVSCRKGMFEMANEGTLFLDEIGELTSFTQVKLLRVLETSEFQRVGGSATLKSDFRFICATNKDLSQAIMDKEFREDLYYRVNTAIIYLPPLRERRADIPLLVDFFLKKSAKLMKKNVRSISNESMCLLMKHEWPGNIRELSHAIDRSVTYCKGSEIVAENLPPEIRDIAGQKGVIVTAPSVRLSAVESSHIYNILVDNHWNMKKAADALDISRSTLYKKVDKYHFNKPSRYSA